MTSREKAKQNLRASGITITQFARERNYPAHAVYKVLNGQYKANFGQAHEIAVALGIKSNPRSKQSA